MDHDFLGPLQMKSIKSLFQTSSSFQIPKFPNRQTLNNDSSGPKILVPTNCPLGGSGQHRNAMQEMSNGKVETPKCEAFSGVSRSETGEPIGERSSEQVEGVLVGVAAESSCKSEMSQ